MMYDNECDNKLENEAENYTLPGRFHRQPFFLVRDTRRGLALIYPINI